MESEGRPDKWSPRGRIEAAHLPGGSRKVLIEDAADARYLPTGHTVFMRQGMMMAALFDPSRLETGPASPVVDGVEQALNLGDSLANSGAGQFSLSSSGTLAYASGGVRHFGEGDLVWVSRNGQVEVLDGFQRGEVNNQLRLSPDGRLLAFGLQDGSLWLFNLSQTTYARQSPEGMSGFAQWNPNGQQLTFSWSAGGRLKVWQKAVGKGAESLEPLAEGQQGNNDIYIIRTETGQLRRLTTESSEDVVPEFSRDGRWIYFGSNRKGSWQGWKLSSNGGHAVQVTRGGGMTARESSDGYVYYVGYYHQLSGIWRVPISGGPETRVIDKLTLSRKAQQFLRTVRELCSPPQLPTVRG